MARFVNPDGFTKLIFPCWIIAKGTKLNATTPVAFVNSDRGNCLALFTDLEHVKNFMAKNNIEGQVTGFKGKSMLVRYLKMTPLQYVAWDPGKPGEQVDSIPTSVLLEDLEAELRKPS